MAFHVGQKVVCIDDRNTNPRGERELVAGRIYKVRWADEYDWWGEHAGQGVRVEGIVRTLGDPLHDFAARVYKVDADIPFAAERFRPLEKIECADEVEKLKRLCNLAPNVRQHADS
jgi:hypothetical protein